MLRDQKKFCFSLFLWMALWPPFLHLAEQYRQRLPNVVCRNAHSTNSNPSTTQASRQGQLTIGYILQLLILNSLQLKAPPARASEVQLISKMVVAQWISNATQMVLNTFDCRFEVQLMGFWQTLNRSSLSQMTMKRREKKAMKQRAGMTPLNARVMTMMAITSAYLYSIGNTSPAYNSIYPFLVFWLVFLQQQRRSMHFLRHLSIDRNIISIKGIIILMPRVNKMTTPISSYQPVVISSYMPLLDEKTTLKSLVWLYLSLSRIMISPMFIISTNERFTMQEYSQLVTSEWPQNLLSSLKNLEIIRLQSTMPREIKMGIARYVVYPTAQLQQSPRMMLRSQRWYSQQQLQQSELASSTVFQLASSLLEQVTEQSCPKFLLLKIFSFWNWAIPTNRQLQKQIPKVIIHAMMTLSHVHLCMFSQMIMSATGGSLISYLRPCTTRILLMHLFLDSRMTFLLQRGLLNTMNTLTGISSLCFIWACRDLMNQLTMCVSSFLYYWYSLELESPQHFFMKSLWSLQRLTSTISSKKHQSIRQYSCMQASLRRQMASLISWLSGILICTILENRS